jgi:hypothetical protein
LFVCTRCGAIRADLRRPDFSRHTEPKGAYRVRRPLGTA